jgi:phage N-6-adenine-methyltransferase
MEQILHEGNPGGRMKGQEQIFGSGNDEWETNPETFIRLHEEFDFEVDVCASETNALLPKYFTKVSNALISIWKRLGTRLFMNPPYSETDAFMRAACSNAIIQKLLVVCLVASRTDTKWWHDLVWDQSKHQFRPGVQVRFLKGRETFFENGQPRRAKCKKACCEAPGAKGHVNSAPFPSVVVIFDHRS